MSAKVSDIMSRDLVTAIVPSTTEDVVKKIIQNNVTGVPVVNASGKYVGMLSRKDIFENSGEDQAAMVLRKSRACHPDDSIEDAAREILSQGRRHIAVIDDENNVVGILTPQNFLEQISRSFGDVPVSKIYTRKVLPVWDETPISLVHYATQLTGLYAFPVVNREGDFVGLITDRDLFNKIDIQNQTVISDTGLVDDQDPWTWDGIRNVVTYLIRKTSITLPDIPARDVMISSPVYVYLHDTLSRATKLMKEKNFNQLPVLEGRDKIAGMLYDTNLLEVLL
ncbi:MAG: CBS domain-containing protein [Candidatus Thermoplasmatota archaeon]|jgi:CBS domain-containing protein|nr:CBS domain-containing protein [Candidatus Thermoplasmatota archaeon]